MGGPYIIKASQWVASALAAAPTMTEPLCSRRRVWSSPRGMNAEIRMRACLRVRS